MDHLVRAKLSPFIVLMTRTRFGKCVLFRRFLINRRSAFPTLFFWDADRAWFLCDWFLWRRGESGFVFV